jgi:hypothetical protein
VNGLAFVGGGGGGCSFVFCCYCYVLANNPFVYLYIQINFTTCCGIVVSPQIMTRLK